MNKVCLVHTILYTCVQAKYTFPLCVRPALCDVYDVEREEENRNFLQIATRPNSLMESHLSGNLRK